MAGAPPGERQARRALGYATIAYVLGWTAHTTFIFYLAPIALRLGDAAAYDAWIFAGTAVASILASLPAGRLADRQPRRRVLRGSLLLLATSYAPLILLPPSFPATLLATLLTGTGLSGLFISFNSYVPDLLAGRTMGPAYARASAFSLLASAGGPFAAAAIFGALPDQLLALKLSSGVFALGAIAGAALTLRLPPVEHHHAAESEGWFGVWRTERRAILPATSIFLMGGLGAGMTTPYFAVYFLDHLRLPPEQWGIILGVATVTSAIGSLTAGRLASTLPPRPLLIGPYALLTLASLAFLFPLPALVLGAVYAIRHTFSATMQPVLNTLLMSRVAAAARGRVQSWSSLGWNVGWATGAASGASLLARLDGSTFLLGAAVGLTGAVVGALLVSARQR